MADFTFAIVVPLASPIQPVAMSKDDTELASRPLISSELGRLKFLDGTKMVPAAPGVNSSSSTVSRPDLARAMRNPTSIRRHRSFGDAKRSISGSSGYRCS